MSADVVEVASVGGLTVCAGCEYEDGEEGLGDAEGEDDEAAVEGDHFGYAIGTL